MKSQMAYNTLRETAWHGKVCESHSSSKCGSHGENCVCQLIDIIRTHSSAMTTSISKKNDAKM